jgi:hypothetical protein
VRKWLVLLCLLIPTLASAQTHPCDQAPAATVTIVSGAPHKVQFCAKSSDNVEALLGLVDTQPFDLVPLVAKTPTPNAAGLTLYESGAFVQVPKGQHTLTLRLYNKNELTGQMQLGEASAPFGFTAVDDTPLPAAPKVLNVVK